MVSARRSAAARSRLAPLAVILVSLFFYGNSAGNGFVLDDTSIVVDNPAIRSLARVPHLFAADYWEPTVESGLYRPLVTLSYALNHAIGGLDPAGYHLVNIALHALVAWLALRLFRRVTGNEWVATGGALYFAAHAVHTEAVANVIGRAELMAAAFFLLALLGHAASEEAGDSLGRRLHAGALLAYAMALLCKENAITLLGVVVLYDLCRAPDPERRLGRLPRAVMGRILTPHYLGFLTVSALYLAARFALVGLPRAGLRLDNPLVELDLPWRWLNAVQVAWRCIWLLVAPLRLSYDYSYDQIPLITSVSDPRVALLVLLSGAGAALFAWSYRGWRPLFFALGFGILTWSIVSNLFITTGTILGERLLYLPSLGFCLAAALLLWRACSALPSGRAARRGFALLVTALVGLNGWQTVLRNRDWASDEALLLAAVDVCPRSAKVRHNAGSILMRQRRPEEAIPQFEAAIEILPDYWDAHAGLGHALLSLGREEEALASYERVVALGHGDARTYNNLGYLLVDREIDVARGAKLLETALAAEPENPSLLDSLGWAYFKLGRPADARELIRRSLEIDDLGTPGATRRRHLEEVERALAASALEGR